MSQIVYVCGRYLPKVRAAVGFEDRGFQFGDGVYEVVWVEGGRIIDLPKHLARLGRSCGELAMTMPAPAALANIAAETIRRNFFYRGALYIQLSRGAARRNHLFPAEPKTTVVMAVYPLPLPPLRADGVTTMADFRWRHCHIKSTSLLASVLARQHAFGEGNPEAWYLDENSRVLEGAASNAWIVNKNGNIFTAPLSNAILSGITRWRVLKLIKQLGFKCEERYFTLEEALKAKEAFYTSTTQFIKSVGFIDNKPIADGEVGETTAALYDSYLGYLGCDEAPAADGEGGRPRQ